MIARRARLVGSLLGLILVAALLLPSPAAADLGGFVIKDFHTDLTVQPDAQLVVEERIAVEFLEPRHGIYRTIPVRYTDPRGFAYSIGFRLLGVTDDAGQGLGTNVSSEGQYVKIRIGDADRTVTGRQVYVIRYRVRDAIGHFTDHDELYWNAVGDEWQTNIEASSATVHLPGPIAADALETASYTGLSGSRDQDVQVAVPQAGEVTYVTSRSLRPREGLTVVAAWPVGYVTFPGPVAKLLRFLIDNFILATPLVALAWLYRKYRASGRDPVGPAAVTVQYEPPAGVSPAQLGTIMDENVDLRDITAAVVDLAVRGYHTIKVEEQKKLFWTSQETVFERNAERGTSDLKPHERQVLDGLFEDGDIVSTNDLRAQFYQHLGDIRSTTYSNLVEQGFFTADPSSVRIKYVLLGVLAGVVTVAVGIGWALFRGGLMPYVLAAPAVAGVSTAVLFAAFARAMPCRTEAGVRMRAWALGFEEFIDRVESDRLERDRAQNVFESLLPYAMALGLAAAWARKFEGIYTAAGGPAWYVGPYPPGGFSTTAFEQNLSSSMAEAAKVMAETPRSSGSSGIGGGGFSGGGFGGGGGGSW